VTILSGAKVVTSEGVIPQGWVEVAGQRITWVGSGSPPAGPRIDLAGQWLLPGFIDLHMHGGGGFDVTASPAELRGAVRFHRSHGTTRTLISLVAAPVTDLIRQLGWVAQATATDEGIQGAHLEGPFLSPGRCGAQNPHHLLTPNVITFDALLAAARGTLKVITLAPELPDALALIASAVTAGVIPAMGHSDATFAQAQAAIDAGVTLATHLFNGMRPYLHREPGIVGAALTSGIACEIINDGIHVHPATTALVAQVADRLILVTDAMAAAGSPDGGYWLGGQSVSVQGGVARLATDRSLAGSTLTMDSAVGRAVQHCGLNIQAASRAASGSPAQLLGIDSDVGSIAPGMIADLVVLNSSYQAVAVMVGGILNTSNSATAPTS